MNVKQRARHICMSKIHVCKTLKRLLTVLKLLTPLSLMKINEHVIAVYYKQAQKIFKIVKILYSKHDYS